MKIMSIDFVRQVIEQTLYEEKEKNINKYYGGKNEVNLFSFYEQLKEDYEVERYRELFRELTDQQNRTGMIMNGTIIAPENPLIMNISKHDITPMSFTCGFQVQLANRDKAIDTIDNLIKVLKGRKRDIAVFDNKELFVVGTIANDIDGQPLIRNGDFIGIAHSQDISQSIEDNIHDYDTLGIGTTGLDRVFIEYNGKLREAIFNEETQYWELTERFNEYSGFEKYKLSISFETIRIDEPHTLNAEEYCYISFGGSATLTKDNAELGNDLTKIGIKKKLIKAQTDISLTDNYHWLEPLEMGNSLGISNQITQLVSMNFKQGKHNDGINTSIEYTFVLDKTETLMHQWFLYSRYGILGTYEQNYADGITPNMIYEIKEIWSSWGNVEIITFNAKATENIDLDKTESDILTLKLSFEVQ